MAKDKAIKRSYWQKGWQSEHDSYIWS